MESQPSPQEHHNLLFGVAYYAEYHQSDRLELDLDLMVQANINAIRVGESVWSTWEPRDNEFDLEWLAPVLDAAHDRGIRVLLGTPTYAVPPWLQVAYPEIAGERRTGEPIPWGGRQEVDYSHPAFRFHAERVIRAIVERYCGHPAVIGYQVDNEPGMELLHNRGVFTRFVRWLKARYGTTDALNREWGLTYWSHRIAEWDELWRPDGNTFPQYDLAWRRFQAKVTSDFIAWQAEIVREYARPDQFVTTCLQYPRRALDDHALFEPLDIAAGNPYYGMQDRLDAAKDLPALNYWTTSGVAGLFRQADRLYSSKQARYLVTETNAQAIDDSAHNFPPYPGQLAQCAFAFVSRGAAMIEYWHWHTLPYGAEEYWGGVLPHSLVPGRVYDEVSTIGARLRQVAPALDGYEPDADVLILWSNPSRYALQFAPPLRIDGAAADDSYERIVDAFHAGVVDAGRQARIMHVEQAGEIGAAELARRFPVLVAAGLHVASQSQLQLLEEYASSGGHLVLGPRTGYTDEEARARTAVAPPLLSAAAGVSYEEYSNIEVPVPVEAANTRSAPAVSAGPLTPDSRPRPARLALGPDAAARWWIEGLRVGSAEALATYAHPHYRSFAAATTAVHGAGRITTVGCVPNASFAADLIRWAAPAVAAELAADARAPLTISSGRTTDGRRVWFVFNWGWDEAELVLASEACDLESGELLAEGKRIGVEEWGCRVLASAPTRTPHPAPTSNSDNAADGGAQ